MLSFRPCEFFSHPDRLWEKFFRAIKPRTVRGFAESIHQWLSDYQGFGKPVRTFERVDDVFCVRIYCDGEVRRQCPWSRCPNDYTRGSGKRSAKNRKLDINSGVVALLVFHFGFGQRSLRTCAPKNRLLRLINETFLNEYGESAQDFRFIFGIHRQIRILPIAKDAQSLELLALDVDELSRKRFRLFANLQRKIGRA